MKSPSWKVAGIALFGFALNPSCGANPPANLLTSNASFEGPDFRTYAHGDYQFEGWKGFNFLYNGHYTVTGDATDGQKFFHVDWGGTLSTAPDKRPAAKPGVVYEMHYDLRTLLGKYPDEWLGTTTYLEFFDADGNRIKSCWGPDWMPQVQDRGAAPWQPIIVRGVAPASAASVGVRVDAPGGMFHDSTHDFTQNRHVEVDNFRLFQVDEIMDRLAVRRFPLLVEPGKSSLLEVEYAATQPLLLAVHLADANGNSVCEAKEQVVAGRGLKQFTLIVPANLKPGGYSWKLDLFPKNDPASGPVAHMDKPGVFSDEAVSLQNPESDRIDADNPNILRMGRWDDSDPKHPWMNWFASEIRIRFNGTSLAMKASACDNGYGGPKSIPVNVVIDGDETKINTVNIDHFDAVFPLATGLSDGVHTATIFKANESSENLRFDGLKLEHGHGLLRPEPLPGKRLEIYGDSVTSGGSASPTYFGYAPLLGRVLNADVHVISKGGTGVAASFAHMVTLLDFWNLLNFTNVFDVSKSAKWDFTKWKPDGVIIAIGHNDQFNGGGELFPGRYHDFVKALRTVYPDVPILCMNTVISGDKGHFEKAILPVMAEDKKVSFAFQLSSWVDPVTGHPPTEAHAAMVLGDKDRYSLADWVEDKLGWGIEPAPSPLSQTAARN